jgi:predicted outer membrane lipoprotein
MPPRKSLHRFYRPKDIRAHARKSVVGDARATSATAELYHERLYRITDMLIFSVLPALLLLILACAAATILALWSVIVERRDVASVAERTANVPLRTFGARRRRCVRARSG